MNNVSYLSKLLNKGTEFCDKEKDKQLVRILNFSYFTFLFTIFPFILTYNIYVRDIAELVIVIPIAASMIWLLHINRKGDNQQALLFSCALFITLTFPVVYINESQIGVPYVGFIASFLSMLYINNSFWKNFFSFYGIIAFLVTNTYQLMYKPFNLIEHLISLGFIFLIFLIFKYIVNLQSNYEMQLQKQNKVIKKQGEDLLQIAHEKHQKELQLKHKDLEMVVANNTTQVQIKENIINRLEKILEEESPIRSIKKIIFELQQQIDSQKKIGLQQDNIDEINSLFYERLYEKAPNISKTEKELCVYIKLGLSTKEIATLKNTSTNTINVTKTRLRNKLGLKTNSDIEAFLREL